MDFFRRQNWDIVGKWKYWFLLSLVPIALGMVFLFTHGLNFGTDFTGGSLFTFEFPNDIVGPQQDAAGVIGAIHAAMPTGELQRSEIQLGGTRQVLVRARQALSDEQKREQATQIEQALNTALQSKGGTVKLVSTYFVGPVVGAELQRNALMAVLIGSLLIVLYVTIRYEFRFAVAGWIALLHDVFVLVGAMAVLRLEVNSSFVAVALTILGFSIHDTIVIFDRIRENRRLHRGADFTNTVNASLLQTMSRSINTVLCVLLPLITLFLFGGQSIRDFVTALIVGIVSGCYSSIFMAAPIVVLWENHVARQKGQVPVYQPSAPRPRAARPATSVESPEEPPEGEAAAAPAMSAAATMVQAQERAQNEKRDARRERRQEKKSDKKGGKGGRKRF